MTRYRPAPGRRVTWPDGRPLRAAGEPIVLTPHWHRLLADADIEPVPAANAPKPRPSTKPAEGKAR